MHSALYIILLIRTCHLSGSSSLKTDFPRIYFLAFQYWNRFWSFINISCCSKIMAKMDPRANCCVKEYFKIPLKATLLAFLRIPKMPAVLRWARGFLVFYKSFCAQIKHFNSLAQKPGVHWVRTERVQGNSNFSFTPTVLPRHNVLACNLLAGNAFVRVPGGFCAGNSSLSFQHPLLPLEIIKIQHIFGMRNEMCSLTNPKTAHVAGSYVKTKVFK